MSDTQGSPARETLWTRLKAFVRKQVNKERATSNKAQIASAFFAATSFLLACLAFGAVLYQVTLIRNNAATATARQVFMEYSKAGITYPMFAYPVYEKLKAGDQLEFNRYRLFVTLMLWAYDEMLLVYDDSEWKESFENDIKAHRDYICNDTQDSDDRGLSKQMQIRLSKSRKSCPPKK